jgi:hypothetical protein
MYNLQYCAIGYHCRKFYSTGLSKASFRPIFGRKDTINESVLSSKHIRKKTAAIFTVGHRFAFLAKNHNIVNYSTTTYAGENNKQIFGILKILEKC